MAFDPPPSFFENDVANFLLWIWLNLLFLYQFHAQKALLKVPKTCNLNFWIENDPPPFGAFQKIHPIW